MSRKSQHMKNHKIFVHMACLLDDLDEVKANSEDAKLLVKLLESVIDDVFKESKGIRNNTYIQELQNKFETVIRKNYKKIE